MKRIVILMLLVTACGHPEDSDEYEAPAVVQESQAQRHHNELYALKQANNVLQRRVTELENARDTCRTQIIDMRVGR